MRRLLVLHIMMIALGAGTVVATVQPATAASVGTFIDDAKITAEVKAKLAAERLGTLKDISVTTTDGNVYLTGSVDTSEQRARAIAIASAVKGVKQVVNNLKVTGTPPSASTSSTPASSAPAVAATTPGTIEATGIVAKVDPATHTITLQDGRVLKATDRTIVWQPTSIDTLKPGTEVLLRNAEPLAFQPSSASPNWRMGTVSRVDPATDQIILTDGAVIQLDSSTYLHRGDTRVALADVRPESEIVARVAPPGTSVAQSALRASDVQIVWTPVAAR